MKYLFMVTICWSLLITVGCVNKETSANSEYAMTYERVDTSDIPIIMRRLENKEVVCYQHESGLWCFKKN